MQPPSPTPPLHQIKITTLNVALFQTSNSAPEGFDPIESFSKELLRGKPDVICLQEGKNPHGPYLGSSILQPGRDLPEHDSFFENLLPGYIFSGSAKAHCGLAMLFLRSPLASHATPMPVPGDAPAVLARVHFSGNKSVVIGSCHLAPFSDGSYSRLETMKVILSQCQPDDKLLIAGDYNMRQKEDSDFESLGILDAWKEAGADKSKKFTFDCFENKFNPPHAFYHPVHARYDRVYFRGLTVDDFQFYANEQVSENPKHFLSDHFGLQVAFRNANSV